MKAALRLWGRQRQTNHIFIAEHTIFGQANTNREGVPLISRDIAEEE
jgi:hypothetical protein